MARKDGKNGKRGDSGRGGRDRADAQEDLREGAVPAPGRAGEAAGVGAHRGCPAGGDLRGQGRGGQGEHDQAGHRVPQPAGRQDRRPAGADRAGADPVVLPAVCGSPARRRRDRAVRPELVQPGRGRARHGVLHQGGVQPVPAPVPDLRAAPRRGRHPAPQVLVLGQRLRAAAPVPVPAGGPDAALEALPDGPGVDHPLGGLLAGQGRDVRAHRHPRGALVRGGQRGQAARADQHDRPPAQHRRLPRRAAQAAGASAAAGYRRATCALRASRRPMCPTTPPSCWPAE